MLETNFNGKGFSLIVASLLFLGIAPIPAATGEPFTKHSSDKQITEALAASPVDGWLAGFASGEGAFPECGAYVRYILQDSQFSRLGIPTGSVLERQREDRFLCLPFRIRLDPESLCNSSGKLVWITPENERREVAVPPGPLGFHYSGFRNMPNWYLRHGQRSADWDRHVLLALERQGRDPKLAESCWATAFGKGYRADKLSSWSGMHLALMSGDFARAEEFAERIVPFAAATNPADFPFHADDAYRLGLLTGNPGWFQRITMPVLANISYATQMPNFLHQADLASGMPAGTPPPSELAASMVRRSFLMESDTSPVEWCRNSGSGVALHEQAAMAQLKEGAAFPDLRISVKSGKASTYFFSPAQPCRDVDVEIRFRIKPEPAPDEKTSGYHRAFVFGLVDRAPGTVGDVGPPTDSRVLLTNLTFGPNDWILRPSWDILGNGNAPHKLLTVFQSEVRDPSPLVIPAYMPYLHDAGKAHTLRIVRVGRQAEALLDGRRLALTHVPPGLMNPGLHLKVVGCTINISSLKADTLK